MKKLKINWTMADESQWDDLDKLSKPLIEAALADMADVKTYAEQVWKYIVQEVGGGQVVCQTDNGNWAVEFCMEHNKPALVRRVLSDEVIYRNF